MTFTKSTTLIVVRPCMLTSGWQRAGRTLAVELRTASSTVTGLPWYLFERSALLFELTVHTSLLVAIKFSHNNVASQFECFDVRLQPQLCTLLADSTSGSLIVLRNSESRSLTKPSHFHRGPLGSALHSHRRIVTLEIVSNAAKGTVLFLLLVGLVGLSIVHAACHAEWRYFSMKYKF